MRLLGEKNTFHPISSRTLRGWVCENMSIIYVQPPRCPSCLSGVWSKKELPKRVEWSSMLLLPGLTLPSLCTWIVLSLFLCPFLPLCSVAATQDCVMGTDKVVETLISLSFELPGHSSLFHLETRYGEGARPPGAQGLPSEVSAWRAPRCLRLVWHHCKWEGTVAGGCFERSVCCCMLCVQPCSRLRDQIQALLLLPLEPVRIWLLLSITAELVAEAAGADSAPGPGLDGSLGCLGEWELPFFSLCLIQNWSQVGQQSKQAACESLPPCLLRFLTFELKLYKGNCFWSLCVSPR